MICQERILAWKGGIGNQHTRICLTVKFREKVKMPNLGPKMPYLGIFGLEFQKTIVIFQISTLKFVNIGVGSAFAKGPGSTFSGGPFPGSGPGPLYNVCRRDARRRYVDTRRKYNCFECSFSIPVNDLGVINCQQYLFLLLFFSKREVVHILVVPI